MDSYELGAVIGFGSFSVVRTARKICNNQLVAIKIVSVEEGREPEDSEVLDTLLTYSRRRIDREVAYWSKLSHPNLCEIIEVIEIKAESKEKPEKIAFVMRLAEGGDLLAFLTQSSVNRRLSRAVIGSYFSQLVSAVGYLHSQGLIHGDVKLENILLCGAGSDGFHQQVILSDFGLTREAIGGKLLNCGTIEYAAPELIGVNPELSEDEINLVDPFKADIWALGVVLYAMIHKALPFDAPSPKILKARILSHEPAYDVEGKEEEQQQKATFYPMLKGLLEKNWKERWSLQQIKEEMRRQGFDS